MKKRVAKSGEEEDPTRSLSVFFFLEVDIIRPRLFCPSSWRRRGEGFGAGPEKKGSEEGKINTASMAAKNKYATLRKKKDNLYFASFIARTVFKKEDAF